MTTTFRIDEVVLHTTDGEVRYTFPSDLTVLAGQTGVGKTTLLELIKYGFGGNGLLAQVAEEHVNDVTLDVTIGRSRLRLTRSLDPTKRRTVRVHDLLTRERLPDHRTEGGEPSLNMLLMNALGLPHDMRAAARGTSVNKGTRITFSDIFSFLYVPQSAINRDIAESQQSYQEPKRKAVFELLFGLTNTDILAMRSEYNVLNGRVATAETETATVRAFLHDSNTTTREEAQAAATKAADDERVAAASLGTLRSQVDPVTDRETQTLRDLLTDAERSLAEARAARATLLRSRDEFIHERYRVKGDLDRLQRMQLAGERLADIEFAICPRCMQSLSERPVPPDACRVCLLPDPVVADVTEGDQYETRQLRDQLAELDAQIDAIARQISDTSDAEEGRADLVKDLTVMLETRTAERITPRLQAFADTSQQLANARARQRQLEMVLRQWDRVNDLQATEDQLRADREQMKAKIERTQSRLNSRRDEILAALNEEFQNTALTLGIPGVQTASIHPTSYLPVLNGKPFASFSPSGGGIRTATQVAYWTTLLAVAQRYPDTAYPAFMLIDTPRLALGNNEDLAAALYRRLVAQADANRETQRIGADRPRLQIIIADNELPSEYRRDYAEIDFTYESPTVSTIRHPGPSAVETLTPA